MNWIDLVDACHNRSKDLSDADAAFVRSFYKGRLWIDKFDDPPKPREHWRLCDIWDKLKPQPEPEPEPKGIPDPYADYGDQSS